MKFYLDFEAAQYTGRIISIGCACENGAKFKSFISLPKGEKVGKEVSELTGITDEMLRSAPTADTVFAQLFEWVRAICKDIPVYYVYGDADRNFLKNTIKKMTDFTAITFASSIVNFMEDYSPNIRKHYGVLIGLNKVYNLMKNTNDIQRHDALEDAEMLQYIDEHLAEASTELPEEYRKPTQTKSKSKGDMPDTKELVERKFYLGLLKKWNGKRRHQAKTDGTGSDHKYLVYHKDSKVECRTYYFTTFENMLAWFFCFNIDGKSIKAEADRNEVKNIIEKAIKDKEVAYNYRIELDEVE